MGGLTASCLVVFAVVAVASCVASEGLDGSGHRKAPWSTMMSGIQGPTS